MIQQDRLPDVRHYVVKRKNASHVVLTDTCVVSRRQVMDLSQIIRPLRPTAIYTAYENVRRQGLYPRFIIDGSVHQGVCMRQYYKRCKFTLRS